ncbi:MAG: DUF4398 domain-containing protein [Bdellovibrionales bacterium]
MKLLLLLSFILVSCQTIPPPLKDYTLARAAIFYAGTVGASSKSPGNWHKAEDFFRRGELKYNQKEYEEAKRYFVLARKYAEKAENVAILKYEAGG